jgi:ubiquinone/menaquinone biosynthesis C-methylase UbiE
MSNFQVKLILFARYLGSSWVMYNRKEIMEKALDGVHAANVLDIGCADGGYLPLLSSFLNASLVIGVDLSLNELNIAKNYGVGLGSECICSDANTLPIKTGVFDFVFLKDLLHHTNDPVSVLSKCKRVLKYGGIIMIVEAERNNPLMKLYLRYGHNHFTLDQLSAFVKQASLKITKTSRVSAYPHHFLFQSKNPAEVFWDAMSIFFLSVSHIIPMIRVYFLRILSEIMGPSYNIILCVSALKS